MDSWGVMERALLNQPREHGAHGVGCPGLFARKRFKHLGGADGVTLPDDFHNLPFGLGNIDVHGAFKLHQ